VKTAYLIVEDPLLIARNGRALMAVDVYHISDRSSLLAPLAARDSLLARSQGSGVRGFGGREFGGRSSVAREIGCGPRDQGFGIRY
jgi:hypothetical protein